MTRNEQEEQRIQRIEQRLDELDSRTRGLVRLGPREPSEEETKVAAKKITDALLAAVPPVDRTQRTLTDGSPVPIGLFSTYRQDRGDGQQKNYVILSAEERAKGFKRPVRQSYVHQPCGTETHMGIALAETYARDPGFYDGTFCCACHDHFPLDQFVWSNSTERLGS